jgi:transcriptional regulator of acetoin/glycerol metabolism
MENPSADFANATTRVADSIETFSHLPEDWRLARAAGVNLLIVVPEGTTGFEELLIPELAGPVVSWQPGERLMLPQAAQTGTLLLHDVGALSLHDQRYLIEWLERAAGQTQVVSLTTAPLLPLVQADTFLARLYYRLNTVCVDMNVTA